MTASRKVTIGDGPRRAVIGGGGPLGVLAGPCVVESEKLLLETCEKLVAWCDARALPSRAGPPGPTRSASTL